MSARDAPLMLAFDSGQIPVVEEVVVYLLIETSINGDAACAPLPADGQLHCWSAGVWSPSLAAGLMVSRLRAFTSEGRRT